MLKDLVPALERNLLQTVGAVPVVLKGLIRTMETGDRILRPSLHTSHELTYVRSGRIKYIIQAKEYALDKGELFVLKPGIEHSFVVTEGPVDLVVVYFGFTKSSRAEGDDAAADMISTASIDQFMEFAGAVENEKMLEPGFYITGRGRAKVATLAEQCLKESQSEDFAKDLMMQALAVELVVEVARALKTAWEENLRVKQGKARELVFIARDYIEEHYAEDISVADAAGYVFLSQGYFARAFRDEMSMSPMAYLIHVRISKACELLQRPDLKVSAIASRVGFSSPQRFNAAFRKQMGMTPMEYRKLSLPDRKSRE